MARTFLRRCLEKDPQCRVHSIGDVRLALDGAFDTAQVLQPEGVPRTRSAWRRSILAVAAAAFAALMTAVGFWFAPYPDDPATGLCGCI
jgi:hypothetical protein